MVVMQHLSPTIIKIPAYVDADPTVHEKAFTPAAVSIGPYHRDNEQLESMNHCKNKYTERFLARNRRVSVGNYRQHLAGLMPHVICCYSEEVMRNTEEEVIMLLQDGCFIIELFLSFDEHLQDDILGNASVLTRVRSDILLVENQLPFFVLNSLYNEYVNQGLNLQNCGFVELSIKFFDELLPNKRNNNIPSDTTNIYHLLHLFHWCATTTPAPAQPAEHSILRLFHSQGNEDGDNIGTATELDEDGVDFNKKKDGSFWNMSFISGVSGVMELSPVVLNKINNTLYRNLVAFEQSFIYRVTGTPVMAYVTLMGCLIATDKDLKLLLTPKVIVPHMRNETTDVNFFRDIADVVEGGYPYLHRAQLRDLSKQVDDHRNNPCRRVWRFISSPFCRGNISYTSMMLGVFLGVIPSVFYFLNYFKHDSELG